MLSKLLYIFVLIFSVSIADTLDDVKKRGYLKCGVNPGLTGFSQIDNNGQYVGFDIDYCKVISTAIFNDPNRVEYKPLSSKIRFTALNSKDVDVLVRNTTWTMTRDTSLGISFGHITFYDGQGFMVPKDLNIQSTKDLNGASICVVQGTTTELNLADYFNRNRMIYQTVSFETYDQAIAAYQSKRCDVITADKSALSGLMTILKNPSDHVILDEKISREPLAIVVRDDDDTWRKIINWSVFVTIIAEAESINSTNVSEMRSVRHPILNQMIRSPAAIDLGLDEEFGFNIIEKVGNYGEIFDRNLGKLSKINLDRGENALWLNGGLQYAPPIR